MLIAGLLRAGGLVRFISNAVMVGFMAGISVTILCGQLAALTGFTSAYENKVAKAADTLVHLGNVDLATTIDRPHDGAAGPRAQTDSPAGSSPWRSRWSCSRSWSRCSTCRRWPSSATSRPSPGVCRCRSLPDLALVPSLLLPAVSLTIIGLVQGAGISRTVPNPDGVYGDASRDFIGQGVANMFSGCFTGGVVGGSVQATALDVGAGARTRWSSVFAGLFVVIVVLVAAPLVQQVPLAVTAGILIVAASSALRPRAAHDIWRADRMSAAVMVVTFVLVLIVPLQYAVLAGAAITVLKHIYLSSIDVRVTQVVSGDGGRLKEIDAPRELSSCVVTVLDIYGSLFFAAGPKVRESLPAVGDARCPVVVLRVRGRGTLHSATIALLREYAAECAAHGGRLYLAGVGQEMEDQLRRTRVLEMLGSDAVVPATDELYGSCAVAQQRGRTWLKAHADDARRATPATAEPASRRQPVSPSGVEPARRMLAAPVVDAADGEGPLEEGRQLAALAPVVRRADLLLHVVPSRGGAVLDALRESRPPGAGQACRLVHERPFCAAAAGAPRDLGTTVWRPWSAISSHAGYCHDHPPANGRPRRLPAAGSAKGEAHDAGEHQYGRAQLE